MYAYENRQVITNQPNAINLVFYRNIYDKYDKLYDICHTTKPYLNSVGVIP